MITRRTGPLLASASLSHVPKLVTVVCWLVCVVESTPAHFPTLFLPAQASSTGTSSQFRDARGNPMPFAEDLALLEFLRTASVTVLGKIGEGITGASKVLLQKDGLRVHGIFRDVRKEQTASSQQIRYLLRDDCIFECAAYELNRLLGLDQVPPVVERQVQGRKGTLQLWVEGAETEKQRKKRDLSASDRLHLQRHGQIVLIFDNLIFNDDRNTGNILHGRDGKLWMIDHTRSFRPDHELPYPSGIVACENRLWKRLQGLKAEQLKPAL